jgi:hypothetical protein
VYKAQPYKEERLAILDVTHVSCETQRRNPANCDLCGRIGIYQKKINISTILTDQRLGIHEVDEGIWLVSFISYGLGFIERTSP